MQVLVVGMCCTFKYLIFLNVVLQDTDEPEQKNISNLQPGIYVFKLTVTDSNNEKDDDTVQVLVLDPEQSSCECSWEM